MPAQNTDSGFFDYLLNLTTTGLKVEALKEGSVCFPRVPLLIITGPLALCQLIETPLLNLINFATLVSTNASRMRRAVGPDTKLLEFGLRRAQGPNGALSASHYSIIGGFDGTSNVLAGKIFNIPISGTHSHSFVNSFTTLEPLSDEAVILHKPNGETVNLFKLSKDLRPEILNLINCSKTPKESELLAFCTYAATYPDNCLCLIDTYSTLGSGLPNFLAVAAALAQHGYTAKGIRIDSGDLSYISKQVRKSFKKIENHDPVKYKNFSKILITASNSVNEETLYCLNEQGHEIDAFGIGTHLVTCQAQPALGGVYKMVQMNGTPRMKLTEDVSKITLPGVKTAYRLYNSSDQPVVDVMLRNDESPPKVGKNFLLRHPFVESKRAYIAPFKVEKLHQIVFENDEILVDEDISTIKQRVADSLIKMRKDHLRRMNPTPYKVSLSSDMYWSLWGFVFPDLFFIRTEGEVI